MSLTEVVFEIADPQYPLCRFTREHSGTRAVYRLTETGGGGGFFRATLTLLGPTETTGAFVRDLKASRRYDELDVLSISPFALIVRLGHRVPEARGVPGIGVTPVERLTAIFGQDTILEPVIAEGGRLRVRALLPQPLDTKRVLLRLQELQRSMAWDHFRVVRVAEFKARQYADGLRRILTLEQEDILRLALALGYYDSPKRCTLGDIAKRIGVSVSPVHKKLKEIEQLLINAHVDPRSAPKPDPRRHSRSLAGLLGPTGAPGIMSEVSLRVRWSGYAPIAWTANHPESRAVLQTLGEDERAGVSTALLVVAAPERAYRELLASFDPGHGLLGTEVASKDSEHVSLKLRTTFATPDDWATHPNPFPFLLHRFGRDAYMKPVVMEGGEAWVRFVVVRGLSDEEIVSRIEYAAKEAKWDEVEIVSLRRVEVDPAVTPLPPPEKMTPRQEEVLKIAHALGYYKTPRECTLEDVANTLGISANAIHKNLTAAEQKIICNYLSAGA